MPFLDFLKLPHISTRPFIGSAPHLYSILQQSHEKHFESMKRLAVLLLAFTVLAVTPTGFLWRIGVVGAVGTFAWLGFIAMDFVGRYWFMHHLTAQDVMQDGRGLFGGDGDVDTYIALAAKDGESVSFAELVEQERCMALGRLHTAKDEADARVADVLERMQGDALRRAESPSDSAH